MSHESPPTKVNHVPAKRGIPLDSFFRYEALAFVGMIVLIFSPGAAAPMLIVSAVLSVASFYQLVVKMMFFAGNSGSNVYGPPTHGFESGSYEEFADSPGSSAARLQEALDARLREAQTPAQSFHQKQTATPWANTPKPALAFGRKTTPNPGRY